VHAAVAHHDHPGLKPFGFPDEGVGRFAAGGRVRDRESGNRKAGGNVTGNLFGFSSIRNDPFVAG